MIVIHVAIDTTEDFIGLPCLCKGYSFGFHMSSIHFAMDTDLIGFPKDVLQGAPLRISLDSH